MSAKASCITSFGRLGMEIHAGSQKGTTKGALVPSPAMGQAQSWDQSNFRSKSPGVPIAFERAGIKVEIAGLEINRGMGWL